MDNVKNSHNYKKTMLTFVVLTLGFAVALTPSVINVDAVPPSDRWGGGNSTCEAEFKGDRYFLNCCWREPIPGSILGKAYCQKCENVGTEDKPVWSCEPKQPQGFESTIKRHETVPLHPLEEPGENKQTNPTFNSNKGAIIDENLAEDQPMQFSSNNEESQELTETNNAVTASNSQENDDSSTSETADTEESTNFAKKGSTQSSPVPPECPKQGPIPPDCTMKLKF